MKKFLPVALMLIIVLAFFWKFFLKNQIPFPGDFVVGIYFPWLDYKWGFPAGVPIKNPIMADVPSFIYPMQMFAMNLIKAGQLPLWNPNILAGSPLLANFQSAPFSPTNFIYFLTDTVNAWGIQIILQHVLAAIFTYLLLRYWKVSKAGSVLGGILFAFSGFNLIWSQWNGHALSAAFMPLILLLVDKWLVEAKVKYLALFSFAFGLQILSGYPQVVLYTIAAISILYLVRIRGAENILKKTILLFVFGLLGLGLSAFQILPGAELLGNSQRSVEPHPFEWAFLPWQKAVTFIAPDFFGNHATKNYWGPQDYTSNTGMVGIVGFALALLATSLIKRSREVLYCFIIAILALLLALPTPLSIFLWKSGFLGFNAASAHRSLVLWNLAIALLAGFGFDYLVRKANLKSRAVALLFPLALLVGFGLYAFIAGETVGLRNLILPAGVFVATAVIVLALPRFRLVLLLLATLELFYFGWKFTPFFSKNLIYPTTPVIEFLQKIGKPNRVVADRVIPINFLMNYGIETLEGYDAVYPAKIAEFIAAVNGSYGSFNSVRRYAIVDDYHSDLLNIANVKYLVILKENEKEYLKNRKFKKVFEDKSVVVLENLNALPRQFTAKNWEVETDPGETFEKLKGSEFKVGKKIIISEAPPKDTKLMLFISDSYYPGWKAYVNGVETKIFRANHAFRAIAIPEGDYELKMIYEPESFYNGLRISAISVAMLLVFVILSGFLFA